MIGLCYIYVLVLLAAFSHAYVCEGTITIGSDKDIIDSRSCTTVQGDVVITNFDVRAQIGYYPPIVSLRGIEEITGSLSCKGNQFMGRLLADDLKSVGSLELDDVPALYTLSFYNLTTARTIHLANLPGISSFTLGTDNKIAFAQSIHIHNTSIKVFKGLNQDSLLNLSLTSNAHLTSADLLPLRTYTDLTVTGNNQSLVVDLSNAISGGRTDIANVNNISMTSMTNLTHLKLQDNGFSSFSTPRLATTNAVYIDGNPNLSNVQMPVLAAIDGTLRITDNGKLDSIALPALTNVTESLELNGTFTRVSLPALKEAGNGITLYTVGDLDCSSISNLLNERMIRGDFPCSRNEDSEKNSTVNGLSSPGAKIGMGVGLGIGVPFMAVLAILAVLYRRRSSTNKLSLAVEEAVEVINAEPKVYELPGSRRDITAELHTEVRGDMQRPLSELP